MKEFDHEREWTVTLENARGEVSTQAVTARTFEFKGDGYLVFYRHRMLHESDDGRSTTYEVVPCKVFNCQAWLSVEVR